MRIMLDTNFLISAFAVGGKIRKIFNLLLTTEWEIIITEYIDSEFRDPPPKPRIGTRNELHMGNVLRYCISLRNEW